MRVLSLFLVCADLAQYDFRQKTAPSNLLHSLLCACFVYGSLFSHFVSHKLLLWFSCPYPNYKSNLLLV